MITSTSYSIARPSPNDRRIIFLLFHRRAIIVSYFMGYRRFRRPLPLVARRSLDVARRSALTACEHPDTRSAIGSRRSPLVARISEFRYAYLLYLL